MNKLLTLANKRRNGFILETNGINVYCWGHTSRRSVVKARILETTSDTNYGKRAWNNSHAEKRDLRYLKGSEHGYSMGCTEILSCASFFLLGSFDELQSLIGGMVTRAKEGTEAILILTNLQLQMLPKWSEQLVVYSCKISNLSKQNTNNQMSQ